MKQKILTTATALVLYISLALAQSGAGGVGIDQPNIDPSAVLDIYSLEQGVLLPRMTTSQILAISFPANGLIVYNTDDNTFHVNVGTPTSKDWISLTPDMAVGFLVHVDGAQYILGNTPTRVQFNFIQFNHGGHYDGSSFYYVVPYDGVYQFNTGVTINSLPPSTDWRIEIVVDGTTMVSSVSSPAGNNTDFTGSASVTLNLSAGKRVYVMVEHRASAALLSNDYTRTWFSGHRLY